MNIYIIISNFIFLSLSVTFLFFYLKYKKKFNETKNKFNATESDRLSLLESLAKANKKNLLIDDILTTKRNGFYKESINLIDDNKNSSPYSYTIYVKEIDRYTNGYSKIEISNIEITAGYDVNQYEWIKKSVKMRFSSLKISTDIEWLESEESLKESRKQKLEKLKELENNKS